MEKRCGHPKYNRGARKRIPSGRVGNRHANPGVLRRYSEGKIRERDGPHGQKRASGFCSPEVGWSDFLRVWRKILELN